jgi:hypothetical protein
MEGFTHGSAGLVRLTPLSELNCPEFQGITGFWEAQFGYDAEFKYPVEVIANPNPESPEMTGLSFEFSDNDDRLGFGEISSFGIVLFSAEWSNQCDPNSVDHSGLGRYETALALVFKENGPLFQVCVPLKSIH